MDHTRNNLLKNTEGNSAYYGLPVCVVRGVAPEILLFLGFQTRELSSVTFTKTGICLRLGTGGKSVVLLSRSPVHSVRFIMNYLHAWAIARK